MARARTIGLGVLGGATTALVRRATRRAMHDQQGAPRLPHAAQRRRGFTTALVWAAAAGLILGLADVLMEQRSASAQES